MSGQSLLDQKHRDVDGGGGGSSRPQQPRLLSLAGGAAVAPPPPQPPAPARQYQIVVSPPAGGSGRRKEHVLDLRPGENWIRLAPDRVVGGDNGSGSDDDDRGTVRPELVPAFAAADSTCFLCLQYHRGLLWAQDARSGGEDGLRSDGRGPTWRAWYGAADGQTENLRPRQAVWLQHGDRLALSCRRDPGAAEAASELESAPPPPPVVPRSVWLEFRCNAVLDREEAGRAVTRALARAEGPGTAAAPADRPQETHREAEEAQAAAAEGIAAGDSKAAADDDGGGGSEPYPAEAAHPSFVYTLDDSSLPTQEEEEAAADLQPGRLEADLADPGIQTDPKEDEEWKSQRSAAPVQEVRQDAPQLSSPSTQGQEGGGEAPAVDEDGDVIMSSPPASQERAARDPSPPPPLPPPPGEALLTQPPDRQADSETQPAAARSDDEVVSSRKNESGEEEPEDGREEEDEDDDATVDPGELPPTSREAALSTKDSRGAPSPCAGESPGAARDGGEAAGSAEAAPPGEERGKAAPAIDSHPNTPTVPSRQRDEGSPGSDLSSQPLLSPPSAVSAGSQRRVSPPIRSNQRRRSGEDLADKLEAVAPAPKPPSSPAKRKSGAAHSPPPSPGPPASSELAEEAVKAPESGSNEAEPEAPADAPQKLAPAANDAPKPPRPRSSTALRETTPARKEPVPRRTPRKRSPFVDVAAGSESRQLSVSVSKKQKVSKGRRLDLDLAAQTEGSATQEADDAPSCVVLTTSFDDSMNQKVAAMVAQLRGELLEDIKDAHRCTHLVASDGKTAMKRTPKLMIALCTTPNIVTLKWLQDSAKAGKLLDTGAYLLLKDREAEKAYSFSMSETLARVKERQTSGSTLLGGRRIYVCPTVFKNTEDGKKSPPAGDLKLIVSAAGGHFVEKSAELKATDAGDLVVITNSDPKQKQKQEAQKDVSNALSNGAVSKPLKSLLHLMMTQDIDEFL